MSAWFKPISLWELADKYVRWKAAFVDFESRLTTTSAMDRLKLSATYTNDITLLQVKGLNSDATQRQS